MATTLVRLPIRGSTLFRSTLPSGSHSIKRSLAPVWRHTICQGSRSLWCSMMDTTTSSPAFTLDRP